MHSKQRLFNIARFEHENEMRRKALKQKKNLESSPFWNPESSTRNPESTGWNPESKTVMDSLTWGDPEHRVWIRVRVRVHYEHIVQMVSTLNKRLFYYYFFV